VLLVDGSDLLVDLDAVGLDPDEILPQLVATDLPRRARIGRCECGDETCGEVTVRITARGGRVVWDDWSSSFGEALPPRLQFDAVQYAEQLSSAEAREWESGERRFARAVSEMIDTEVACALAWRGLHYREVIPAGDDLVAVRLTASYAGAEWSVYVVVPTSQDPESVRHLLTRRGPTAWPNVFWWGDNEAAAIRQPPMAGRRWRMWQPTEA